LPIHWWISFFVYLFINDFWLSSQKSCTKGIHFHLSWEHKTPGCCRVSQIFAQLLV
jgi:hypothetical protein